MAKIDIVEEKWYRKAIAGFRENWARMVKQADSFEAFVKGIAAATGIPEGTVRNSLPAKNWADFQANAEKYLSIALEKLEAAFRSKKWSRKYKKAFGG